MDKMKASGSIRGLSQEARETALLITRNTGMQQKLLLQFRKKRRRTQEFSSLW
jgi:hypothetical protein